MNPQQYTVIEAILDLVDQGHSEQDPLAALPGHLGLSEPHTRRLFSDWAGISPEQFLQFLSREYLKQELGRQMQQPEAVVAAALSGISGSDPLRVSTEGMSPETYRSQGHALDIHYGLHDSPLGPCLLALCGGRICHLSFADGDIGQALNDFRQDWALATLLRDDTVTDGVLATIFFRTAGTPPPALLLRGTPFQLRIWEMLIRIPESSILSYQQLATAIKQPSAIRAAASAVARNRIALLVPCHRVIRKSGETGEYRWGRKLKRILLAAEAAFKHRA